MKRFLIVLVLCLVPSLAVAGEEEVLKALENIRKALDTGVAAPVNETLDRLLSEAEKAIQANEEAGDRGGMFTTNARKSLGYYQNIARMTKMGVAPFDADRQQADKFLLEAYRVHRDKVRKSAGSDTPGSAAGDSP